MTFFVLLSCCLFTLLLMRALQSFFVWTFECNFLHSLATWKIFSKVLILSSVVIMCLKVVFFMFLLLGISWTSWFCGFISLVRLGHILSIISSNIFLSPLFSSSLGIPITCIIGHLKLTQNSLMLFRSFKILFFCPTFHFWIGPVAVFPNLIQ